MKRPWRYLIILLLVLVAAIIAYRFAMGVQRGDLPRSQGAISQPTG